MRRLPRLPVTFAMLVALTAASGLIAPREAAAQFNAYYFPVEKGTVESMVELQLCYSHLGLDLGSRSLDADMVTLSIEGQYAIAGFFEVGLNVPFIQHASSTSTGWLGSSSEETRFGNIELGLKAKVFSVGGFLSLAAFLDTYLPTHSGEGIHDFAVLIPGAALSGQALGFIYGAALKFPWFIIGDIDDAAMIGLDFYFGYQLLGLLSFQLAFQYANSIHPETDLSPFAIVPGIDVTLIKLIRLGLASRIAINDDAELFYAGRISLLFHGGFAF